MHKWVHAFMCGRVVDNTHVHDHTCTHTHGRLHNHGFIVLSLVATIRQMFCSFASTDVTFIGSTICQASCLLCTSDQWSLFVALVYLFPGRQLVFIQQLVEPLGFCTLKFTAPGVLYYPHVYCITASHEYWFFFFFCFFSFKLIVTL